MPTNRTRRDILRKEDENDWHSAEDIRLLTVMAALFHDIGKASQAFQAKLRNRGKPMADAYRHEWVSLRLFEAFVGPGSSDEDWLRRLADKRETGDAWLSQLARDDRQPAPPGPFQKSRLPPLAQAVGWLIVSHHRLPNGDHRGSASLARLPAPIQSQWCGARDADAKKRPPAGSSPTACPSPAPIGALGQRYARRACSSVPACWLGDGPCCMTPTSCMCPD